MSKMMSTVKRDLNEFPARSAALLLDILVNGVAVSLVNFTQNIFTQKVKSSNLIHDPIENHNYSESKSLKDMLEKEYLPSETCFVISFLLKTYFF